MEKDYIEFVKSLESVPGEIVLGKNFDEVVVCAQHLDTAISDLKRTLFYRKEMDVEGYRVVALNARLVHSVLGKLGECCEMVIRVHQDIGNGGDEEQPPDLANWLEELGDDGWYTAIAQDVLGLSIEKIRETNQAKLTARYPNGFSLQSSDNRDRLVERQLLEAAAESNNEIGGAGI